jgi:hypothetical protein
MCDIDWSVTKDIIVSIAAIVTAGAAVYGFRTWRRELTGKARFETARSMMRAAFDLRDALENARAPWVDASEFPPVTDNDQSTPALRADALRHAYNKRWKPVYSAMTAFRDKSAEAEVIFGAELRGPTDELVSCVTTFSAAIRMLIDDKAQNGAIFDSDRQLARRVMDDVHSIKGDRENALTDKLHRAVEAIVARLQDDVR